MDESETFSNDDDLINPEVINTHVVYLALVVQSWVKVTQG